MQKQDWITHIECILSQGRPFNMSYIESNKAPLVFACDTFRRRKYPVTMSFEPTQEGLLNMHVTIMPIQNTVEITVKRDDTLESIIQQISSPVLETATIRGCGTVINIVCEAIQFAIHNGWFVEKSFMNTLVQMSPTHAKQRNTTLSVFLRRGSYYGTI
jgi:hypothetical protein